MSIRPLSVKKNRSMRERRTVHEPKPTSLAIADGRTTSHRRELVYLIIAFWLVAIATAFAPTASGQQAYQKVEMDKRLAGDAKKIKAAYSNAKNFAAGRDANMGYVKVYYTNYVGAILTNPEYSHEVTRVIRDYYKLLEGSKNYSNLAAVNNYVLSGMGPIAVGNYPPPARINAIHALSNLDTTPAKRSGSAGTPPVPHSRVLPVLIRIYRDEKSTDGVRAAALHGIHRHVSYGFQRITGGMNTGLVGLMTQLLDEPPPQGRSPDAHAYLQRFAVDILEMLRPKGNSVLGEKLVAISTDKTKPDLIALYSAAGVGVIGKDMAGKVADPAGVLNSWSRRALAVMETELHRLESLDRADPAGGQPPAPGDPSSGGSTGSGNARSAGRSTGGGMGGLGALGGGGNSRSRESVPESNRGGGGMGALGGLGGLGGGEERGRQRRTERVKEPLPGENQPPEVVASRRLLNHAFEQLKMGVTGSPSPGAPSASSGGLYASVADDAKPAILDWVSQLQSIVDEVNGEYLETRKEYVDMLTGQVEQLREAVGDEPAAKPEAKPADAAKPAEVAADPDAESAAVSGS